MSGRVINLLLVEDNPGDVRLIREAFDEAEIVNNMNVVADGVEAMAYLRREGAYSLAPRPDIVLLDLNLPKKDGREVLTDIKADEDLKRIPVIVLTSSNAERDILSTYGLHANCYVTKPADLDEFISVVRSIHGFWLGVAKLPGMVDRDDR